MFSYLNLEVSLNIYFRMTFGLKHYRNLFCFEHTATSPVWKDRSMTSRNGPFVTYVHRVLCLLVILSLISRTKTVHKTYFRDIVNAIIITLLIKVKVSVVH